MVMTHTRNLTFFCGGGGLKKFFRFLKKRRGKLDLLTFIPEAVTHSNLKSNTTGEVKKSKRNKKELIQCFVGRNSFGMLMLSKTLS